tara:strand:+ start:935 stop:1297 length:363 start_codon:yes stop_codon:yes gene_type:complete
MGEIGKKCLYSCIEGLHMEADSPKEEPRKELTEVEEWELERKLMELAFENSFMVLTERTTFEELMYENHSVGKSSVLAHDPHEGVTCDELCNLLYHFEELEEYEMCAELKPLLSGCTESN